MSRDRPVDGGPAPDGGLAELQNNVLCAVRMQGDFLPINNITAVGLSMLLNRIISSRATLLLSADPYPAQGVWCNLEW